MGTARALQVTEPKAPFRLVDLDPPAPGPGQARIRVRACGICHSDSWSKEGGHPSSTWPIVPGHEIAGVIDALGEGVEGWSEGQRVGVGWFGGHCGWCGPCRSGDLMRCEHMPVTGLSVDGGYADYAIVRSSALAAVPDALSFQEVAPLMCAGVTTFNGLRRSDARAGDLVAIVGLGGLGHLGVQFAAKMGFETVAIARGTEKADLARQLGAHHYIDSSAQDPGEALTALGGAKVLLSTAPSADTVQRCMGGMRRSGQVVMVGVPVKPLRATADDLINRGISLVGHTSGTARDSEDALRFSALTGVRPMVEPVPLDSAEAAYERMVSGAARFRMVLVTEP